MAFEVLRKKEIFRKRLIVWLMEIEEAVREKQIPFKYIYKLMRSLNNQENERIQINIIN